MVRESVYAQLAGFRKDYKKVGAEEGRQRGMGKAWEKVMENGVGNEKANGKSRRK